MPSRGDAAPAVHCRSPITFDIACSSSGPSDRHTVMYRRSNADTLYGLILNQLDYLT